VTKQADTDCHIPLPLPRLLYSDLNLQSSPSEGAFERPKNHQTSYRGFFVNLIKPTCSGRTRISNMTTTPQSQSPPLPLPISGIVVPPSLSSNEMYTLLVDPPLPRFIAWVSLDRFYGAFGRIWRSVRRWDADCLLLLLLLFLLVPP
jgi:hypothetical protein